MLSFHVFISVVAIILPLILPFFKKAHSKIGTFYYISIFLSIFSSFVISSNVIFAYQAESLPFDRFFFAMIHSIFMGLSCFLAALIGLLLRRKRSLPAAVAVLQLFFLALGSYLVYFFSDKGQPYSIGVIISELMIQLYFYLKTVRFVRAKKQKVSYKTIDLLHGFFMVRSYLVLIQVFLAGASGRYVLSQFPSEKFFVAAYLIPLIQIIYFFKVQNQLIKNEGADNTWDFKNWRLLVVYVIFLQALWPSLFSLIQIAGGAIPHRSASLFSTFQLAPNSLVFDRPQFFRKGRFIITFSDGSQSIVPYDSELLEHLSTYQTKIVIYHSMLSSDRSGPTILMNSAMKYLFCDQQRILSGEAKGKSVDHVEFEFVDQLRSSQLAIVREKC